MQEVILSLIVLTALITPLYKLIKRRRRLKQELLLEDIDTIHYGPFSGQYSIRKYVLTFLLCSSQLSMVLKSISANTIWELHSKKVRTYLRIEYCPEKGP